ncbi:hypothetical protein NNK45_01645 [Staphylococcus aureus]|nr:hypothetical protein [Staphylococcus aureus]
MILVVDNYDSFTYNLVDIVAQHTDVIVQYPDDDNVLNQSVDAVIISPDLLYQDIPEQFSIMRYHSLISNPDNFPEELKITGRTKDCIQSFEHKERPHYGIQYHPESFATDYGVKIITNFINLVKEG